MIRQRIRFYGNVQGVGFRYTAKYAARSLGLTGWVYNDYDGSVLMEVQGNAETIEKQLQPDMIELTEEHGMQLLLLLWDTERTCFLQHLILWE